MKILIILILLFFVLFTSVAYACYYNFCSPIACSCDSSCIDSCNGGYWYSNGKCSSDCFSSNSNHCKYETRTCADADNSDGVPNVNGYVRTCGAECDQNSDCSCPQSGCIGQDYYSYSAKCNEGCKCECNPVITTNDSRCFVCDNSSVDCNNPACTSNIQCLPCDTNNVNCSIPACASNALCVPCDSTNVNCSVPSCSSNPKCAPCDVSNVDCNVLACANNTQCLPCDANNVDCNVPACANNTNCLPCNNDNVNCSIPSCAGNTICIPSPPAPTGVGGMTISGGYIPPIINLVVCGDKACTYNETCANCPKDCLKQGEVCCYGIAYPGNCCVDQDCGNGYECNISKICQPIPAKPNITVCTEEWTCSDWSECLNGVARKRECIDKNNCGTIADRPDLVQRCTFPAPTGIFLFITTPFLLGLLALIIILFLIIFFWRRRKKKSQLIVS